MGKQSSPRRRADNEAQAVLRNLRISPQKLNLVAAMIRGMDANKAIATLSFSRRRIANDVKKVLQSAIANAENNHSLDVDRLYVKEAHVGKGLVMKRFKARARGRGARILKPFSHLTIVVGERGPEIFVPNSSGTVIPNDEIGMATGAGGGDNIEVTFNINTLDATDFDTLLTTRQDLIIGLINRGLAERGKRSLLA